MIDVIDLFLNIGDYAGLIMGLPINIEILSPRYLHLEPLLLGYINLTYLCFFIKKILYIHYYYLRSTIFFVFLKCPASIL